MPSLEDLPKIFDGSDLEEYEAIMQEEHAFYQRMIEKAKPFKSARKRTREVFRGVLGTSYYTEFYWTLNFRALMNFLELRLGEGAQPEIQRYAQAIKDLVRDIAPLAFEALEQYILKHVKTNA